MSNFSEGTYNVQQIKKHLVGMRLIDAKTDEEDGAPILVFENQKKTLTVEVAVLQDPEGNGPGWIDIPKEIEKH